MENVLKPNEAKEILVECCTDLLIVVLSADLLYLYFAGAWYEPIRLLRVLELVLLFFAVAFGCWRFASFVKRKRRGDVAKLVEQ